MPYDGSGNFTIINNFEEDRINGVSIDSLKMDNNFNDIANGLSEVMLRSGSVVMTGILNMGDHKITNLVAGTSSKDAINKEQMDTALSAKQATITGGASTITSSNLTANRALVSSSSGKVAVSAVTATELGYLSGVTSAIQAQLNAVVHLAGTETITGDKTFTNNFIHYKTDIAYTETPSANKYGGFNFLDKNGTEIGAHYAALYSSGSGFSGFNLRNKSGNTATLGLRYNTSGTFYTEAPAPTDTTTTSGTQIATTGWVNSTDNNAVHKTGDETIAGNKTFSGNVKLTAQSGSPQSGLFISSDYTTYAVSVQNNSITKGTAPSSNSYCGIDFYGTATTNYANRLGLLEFRYDTDKLTSASLCAFKSNTASDSVSARVAVHYPPTGNPYTEAPASDANNSIVTTVGKNKAQNGYFKLGNGLIIQWGRFTVASGKTSATITFPTAFTSTNYSINCMQNSKNGGYQYDGVTGVTSRNTANCTVYTFYDSTGYDWIAIGY